MSGKEESFLSLKEQVREMVAGGLNRAAIVRELRQLHPELEIDYPCVWNWSRDQGGYKIDVTSAKAFLPDGRVRREVIWELYDRQGMKPRQISNQLMVGYEIVTRDIAYEKRRRQFQEAKERARVHREPWSPVLRERTHGRDYWPKAFDNY